MRRCDFILVVGMLLSGVITGIIFQNKMAGILQSATAMLAILAPFVLVVGIINIFRIFNNRSLKTMIRYLILLGSSSILFLIVTLITVSLINRWKVAAVETYVLQAVPVLDRIKAQSGKYPSQLPTELIGQPPSLLRSYGSYTATSGSFCFEYINEPAGWAGGEGALKFESSTRKWIVDR